MNFFDNISRFFNEVFSASEEKSEEVQKQTYSQDVLDAFGVDSGSSSGITVSPENALRVATVYACVAKLAGGISTLPLKIYETDGKERSELPKDHLWYLLNESPYIDFSAASAWENVSISNSLRGDAFWWIRRRPNGQIKDLFPLPWSGVNPYRMPDGSVRYYVWYPEFGLKTWLEPMDVLHFPGLGFDGLKSMSVIKYAARNATGNALAMDEYSGQFFRNGAHPSVILQFPAMMTPEQIELLQAQFVKKYSGIENARKTPLILTEGGSAHELSISAEDSQLLEARKFQVVDIARAFGVPPHMIGETSASTSWGSGIEAMTRGFFTYTLQQNLIRIEQELNRKLYPKNYARRIEYDREALLEGDTGAQASYFRAALGGPGTGLGWMTVDEVRGRKNLSPLGGAAAEIYDPRLYEGNSNGKTDGNLGTEEKTDPDDKPDTEPEKGDGNDPDGKR